MYLGVLYGGHACSSMCHRFLFFSRMLHVIWAEIAVNDCENVIGAKGLGEIRLRSAESPFEFVQHAVTAGENDKRGPGKSRFGLEVANKCVAINLWHLQVYKHERWNAGIWGHEPAQERRAIGKEMHICVACSMQAYFENFAYSLGVIYNHYQLAHAASLTLLAFCHIL